MRFFLIITVVLASLSSFSQGVKNVFIKDKDSKEPLAFATIYNITAKNGVVSNLEGNARLNFLSQNDIIKISFIGYKTKNLAISQIPESGVIFLEVNSLEIKEFIVLGNQDQDFIASLLQKIVKENKKQLVSETTKTTLITESTVNDVPLERQESIGNSEVSTNSVSNYKVKLGRFGQNKSFNFYTLTATDLASKFQVLSKTNTADFPEIITHLSKNKMKKRYTLSYFKNPYGDTSLMKIVFESKSGEEFSGEVLFFTQSKKLKQVAFWIEKPSQKIFFPVIESHKVEVMKLKTTLNFSDKENRLNYIMVEYKLDYQMPESNLIDSRTIFTFDDYQEPHSNPYYTGEIDFEGEYYQILFNSFDQRFWEENFNYTNSKRVDKTYEFFKENGYVSNFNKYSSDSLFEFLDIRIKNWDTTRIAMTDLNYKSSDFGIKENVQLEEDLKYNESELYSFNPHYYSNLFTYLDQDSNTVFKSKFDFKNSYYFLKNDWKTEVAMNIYFDIFKINSKTINRQKEVIKIWKKSIVDADKFLKSTERGENLDSLLIWNEIIKKKTDVDNIMLFINKKNEIQYRGNELPNYFNVGAAYLHLEMYEKALYFFNIEYNIIESRNKFFELTKRAGIQKSYFTEKETKEARDLMYNRALTYLKLNQPEKACVDFQFAFDLGDLESGEQLEKHCK